MSHVVVDLKEYSKALREHFQDLLHGVLLDFDRKSKAAPTHPLDLAARIDKMFPGDPDTGPLCEAIRNGDEDGVREHRSVLLKVFRKTDGVDFRAVRSLMEDVDDYVDKLSGEMQETEEGIRERYETYIRDALKQSAEKADDVAKIIDSAIGRIDAWTGSKVYLDAIYNRDSMSEDYTPSAWAVAFGTGTQEPGFTMFLDGPKVQIEDLLEGGDDDFFRDPAQQYAYFALVSELRKPGSSQQGRTMTLYTARPTKDRARYDDARDIPVNIFLTSSEDEAIGIAHDLGGHEVRDVWLVKINSRYLSETWGNRQYQVVGKGPTVPVLRMELIVPGH